MIRKMSAMTGLVWALVGCGGSNDFGAGSGSLGAAGETQEECIVRVKDAVVAEAIAYDDYEGVLAAECGFVFDSGGLTDGTKPGDPALEDKPGFDDAPCTEAPTKPGVDGPGTGSADEACIVQVKESLAENWSEEVYALALKEQCGL